MKWAWLALCGLLAAAPTAGGSESVNWRTDFEQALDEAIMERKPLFVTFYTDWCGWCKKLNQTTFRDSTFTARLQRHYIPTRIHGERQRGVAAMFQVRAYPTTIFLSRRGDEITRLEGYRNEAEFDRILLAVLPHREPRYDALESQAAKHPDNPNVLYAWGEALLALGRHTAAARAFQAVLDSEHPDASRWTEEARLDLALAHRDPSRRAGALEAFLEEHPRHDRLPFAMLEWGRALLDTGRKQEAREVLTALASMPNAGFARERAEELLADPGPGDQ